MVSRNVFALHLFKLGLYFYLYLLILIFTFLNYDIVSLVKINQMTSVFAKIYQMNHIHLKLPVLSAYILAKLNEF